MTENIIFAPGLNETELAGSLALHGVNTIGLRISGAAGLARLALMRSGISIPEDYVNFREEAAIVAEAISGEEYFSKTSCAGIRKIAAALRRMRSLIDGRDEEKELERILSMGEFKEKNDALLHVYRTYMKLLSDRGAVDAVSLIRRAAAECSPVNARFLTLEEYPLNPLEKALLSRVSGGKVREMSLPVLYGADSKRIHVSSIKNCYGSANEVESILEEIYSGKQLDRCTVAVANTAAYSQLFFDYALRYGIPVSFGCGIPIVNSCPAQLASLYYRWSGPGFFGKDSILEMLRSDAFDREKLYDLFPQQPEGFSWKTFYEVLGNIRFTNERDVNEERLRSFRSSAEKEAEEAGGENSGRGRDIRRKYLCIPFLEIAARELALPAEDFILKYSRIRKGSSVPSEQLVMDLDMAAAEAVYQELASMRSAGKSLGDVLPNLLNGCVLRQRSEAGKLHISSIGGALASVRENLFIAGLSAANYPGSPMENYLLLDSDLKLFGSGAMMYASDSVILRRRNALLSLVGLAADLGSDISISYSGMNVAELKKDNPSSLIYELLREEDGSGTDAGKIEDKIIKTGYFEPAVSASRLVGEAYTRGQMILTDSPGIMKASRVSFNPGKAWSPSELDVFFSCPRRFMLKYMMGIPEPEVNDPFTVISAPDRGSLVHSLMEELGKSSIEKEEFLKLSEEYFDRFLIAHPPLIREDVRAVREQFLEMMETAYKTDPHRTVVLAEEEMRCTHESGVEIKGILDRVEKLDDGTYLIVDFKTDSRIKRQRDDIKTCLQVVMYAYLMEHAHKGCRVSGGEYRYLMFGQTVTCRFDDEMKRKLTGRLLEFKESVQSGVFPIGRVSDDGRDPCTYCRYGRICGKAAEETDTEEGGTE